MKTILVIGAGSRSNTYCTYFLENPHIGKVIAVAEPNKERRLNFSNRFSIPQENQYNTWEDVLLKKNHKIADFVLIGTLCDLHAKITCNACRLEYNIILEKPISHNFNECIDVYECAKQYNSNVIVCHVMRYHPLYQKARDMISKGLLGDITIVQWLEPVNRLLYAKSYLRNPCWSHNALSGPLTLAKGCHDFDLIYWMLGATDAMIVSSVAQKNQFLPSKQPKEAEGSVKCSQCPISKSCTFSALENYGTYQRYRKYVSNKINPSREEAIEDLTFGPYDQCVYHSNSDIMEDYVITMKVVSFDNVTTVSMVFSAFHNDICWRTATFIGTEGTLTLSEKDQTLVFQKHVNADGTNNKPTIIDCDQLKIGENEDNGGDSLASGSVAYGKDNGKDNAKDKGKTQMTGHSGADYYFMESVMKGNYLSSIDDSMASHILAFDADQARIDGIHWRPKQVSRIRNKVKIAVTSLNKNKLDCVSRTFESSFNCIPIVKGYNSDSGVPDGQPYGVDGTYQGAQQRINNIQKQDFDFIVSIENGIIGLQNNDSATYIDFPLVIIHDVRNKKDYVQIGGSRSIPLEEMRKKKQNGVDQKTRGSWVRKYYEKMNYTQTRESLIEYALAMCIESLKANQ